MKRTTGPRAALPRLPDAPVQYEQTWASDLLRTLDQTLEQLAYGQITKPLMRVECARSGAAAALTATVIDFDRRVVSIEFNKREGSGAATGWVSTWDTTTGTIGTDASLIRIESVSIPAGLDSAAAVRLKWRDQQGQEQIEEYPVPLAHLSSTTKTYTIPFTSFKEQTYGLAEIKQFGSGPEYIRATSATAVNLYASAILPVGAVVTDMRVHMYRTGVSDSASFTGWHIPSGGTPTNKSPLASVSALATWETVEGTLTEFTVAARDTILFSIQLDALATGDDVRAQWCEIEYRAPTAIVTL